jgi:DNA-binding transcriptional LysR family regulator
LFDRGAQSVKGKLRVAAPFGYGRQRIAPLIVRLARLYPELNVQLDLRETPWPERAEADIVFHIGSVRDSSWVARTIADNQRWVCASPAYLAQHGAPRTPEDLASHKCLIGRGARLNACWPVQRNGETHSIPVSGNFLVNNGEVLRDAAMAGLGIMMGPRWQVEDDLAAGRLVELLPEFVSTNRAIYAVLPRQGTLTPKVRAFVDFLKACCAEIQ